MKISFLSGLFFTLFFNSISWSQNTVSSLREKAESETRINGLEQKSATTAQISGGMLKLKDPRPEVITRTWHYFAGLTAQSYKPSGKYVSDSVGDIELSKANTTQMSGIIFGLQTPELKLGSVETMSWQLGFRADANFASQSNAVTFSSGYRVNDARLNSNLFAVGPSFNFNFNSRSASNTTSSSNSMTNTNSNSIFNLKQTSNHRLPGLSFNFIPQYGTLSYTQTSANEYARFSKSTDFLAFHFDLELPLNNKLSLFTEYSMRSLLQSQNDIDLQKDNFGLGTKILW